MAVKFLITFAVLTIAVVSLVASRKPKTGKYNFNYKPWFTKKLTVIKRHENLQTGLQLDDISSYAKDDEGDPLLYRLDSAGEEICTIGQKDGILKLRISPDREQKSAYSFKVMVSDTFEGGVNREAELQVYFYVLDVNDNTPIFQNTPYHVDVKENTTLGTQILNISATDKDAAGNGEVRYKFKDDMENTDFKLHPNTGTLTLVGPLDYETKTSHVLEIVAQDGGSPSLVQSTKVVVNVKDVDDMKPRFVSHRSLKEVNENVPIGTSIAIVSAEDGDKAINNEINYAIIAGDEYGLFHIDQKTGNVTVQDVLDREFYSRFTLKIKAYEVPNKASYDTINLQIKLLDVNDNRPKFKKDAYLVVLNSNDVNPKTIVYDKIKAHDDDTTWTNNFITYWMDNEYFDVLPDSGMLILKKSLGNEEYHYLKVYATEKETTEHYSAKASVTVHIKRLDDIKANTVRPEHDQIKNNAISVSSLNYKLLMLSLICALMVQFVHT